MNYLLYSKQAVHISTGSKTAFCGVKYKEWIHTGKWDICFKKLGGPTCLKCIEILNNKKEAKSHA